MPKRSSKKTSLEISRLRCEGAHAVGMTGLYLKIEGGSRAWVFRYVHCDQRHHMGLANYRLVGLAHVIDTRTEAAYRHGDMLEKHTAIMQTWAAYVVLQCCAGVETTL